MVTHSYTNKTCIVTGAAGGLGLAIAKAFLQAGANVVISDINASRLAQCTQDLSADEQQRFLSLEIDVTSTPAVEEMFAAAVKKFGRLDVLVNNAGVLDNFDPVGDLKRELWDKVIAVNLTAPMVTSGCAVRQMLKQEPAGGTILNVGSASSGHGFRAGVAYTASKHGLQGMTKNTAAFYGQKGIRCLAILPGAMQTNISDDTAQMSQSVNMEGIAVMRRTMGKEPMWCPLEEVAKMAMLLCGDGVGAVNGACIPIDNGWTAV